MSHHHHHHHDLASERMGWAFFLNLGFTVIEFIGGMLTNSTAIMADAIHDLGDSLSIGLAWILNKLGNKSATHQLTYGYRRLSLVGALLNAVVLVGGSIWVLSMAIPRLLDPVMPHTEGMLGLAVLGVLVNGFAAYKLSKGKSLNERVLNWHLIEDVLGWVAVLVVALILMVVDWPILDPLLSVAFTLFILINVVRTLRETLKIFLQGNPDHGMYHRIAESLQAQPEVADVHHLHLWSLDGEHHVCTAHIVLAQELTSAQQRELKQRIAEQLAPFELAHTTIEFELPEEPCRDT
ncbi:cation transporter [Pseudidiomarina gelatinasegens]|jgi:cobalt-zinc-cadmium efflux system protein|uniref:Cation transporter n=1 Tax=Pseudidiomarina gelatinasegens TaxID=2487740 RepID=A0A443YZR7_9GAMM|nr:cation diffusion facilitator family transporter [Pseudidiomarina gelatinasegens]RWU09662.1 cation transporter [Pseudidiomarina gelatinasegens]